jgi:acyl dehydratase
MRTDEEFLPLETAVTRTLIVAGAVATRDYQDVHYDAEAARKKGSPDVLMNVLTTNGLMRRCVTDCPGAGAGAGAGAGPGARLRAVRIRLGEPNCPGGQWC